MRRKKVSRGRPPQSPETERLSRESKADLIQKVKDFAFDTHKLAEHYGVTYSRLYYWIRKKGIRLRPRMDLFTDEELDVTINVIGSATAVQRYFGINISELIKELEKRGIEWPYRRRRVLEGIPAEVLEKLYIKSGYSWRVVAEELGVHRETLERYRKELGLESIAGSHKHPFTYRDLHFMYVEQGYGCKLIARAYQKRFGTDGPTDATVSHALKRLGIPTRPPEVGMRPGWMAGRKYELKRDSRGRVMPHSELPKFWDEVHGADLSDEAWMAEDI